MMITMTTERKIKIKIEGMKGQKRVLKECTIAKSSLTSNVSQIIIFLVFTTVVFISDLLFYYF